MYPFLSIFEIAVPSYPVWILIGIILGGVLFLFTKKRFSFSVSTLLFSVLYAVIFAYIGAKLLYIIVEWERIFSSPNVLEAILNSGLVFYGGLVGTVFACMIYAKRISRSWKSLFDTFVPSLTLAHAFGRVGCFFAGCCYGRETSAWFGVVYPEGGSAPAGQMLIPTQLFETAFLLLLTAGLIIALVKEKREGLASSLYFLCYAIWRFFIEFFRNDRRGSLGALSTSQWLSIVCFLFGVGLLIHFLLQGKEKKKGNAT